jgi:hypothetical protein
MSTNYSFDATVFHWLVGDYLELIAGLFGQQTERW